MCITCMYIIFIYIHGGKQIQVRQFCIHIPYVLFYCFKSERELRSVFICVFQVYAICKNKKIINS